MSIGTAVPTQDELNAVKHHFIHNKSIHETYDVGQYENDALQTLRTLFVENNKVVMVGGSGLYVNAVVNGLDEFPDVSPEIRKKLNVQLLKKGIENDPDTDLTLHHLPEKLRIDVVGQSVGMDKTQLLVHTQVGNEIGRASCRERV